MTAPSTKGTYHYGACVDAVAGETNDANNCSSAFTLTINALGPDLVVTKVNVPTRDPIVEEDFWISIHVKNQGDSRALSPMVRFYRSNDATISSSDTEIGTARLFGMDPSQEFDSGSIKEHETAPSTAGTYYYGACMDSLAGESDVTNNCSSAAPVTVIAASESDLVIERFWISAIEFYFPLLPLYATVRNQGSGSSAETPVGFYLSTDATISTSDTRIDGQYVKRLAPSETSRYGSVQVTTSAQSTPGTYYYGACVSPVSGETDTTNNCSDAVAVTVGDVGTAPGAPTGLTATADGQTEIDLSWTAPSDDGGADITGYLIEVSTNGSSWSDLVSDTGTITTGYSHSGLTAGSTRHYRVSAINSAGTSEPSSSDSATTDSPPVATAPDAPTSLTATADDQTEIDLSWTAPSNDGGADITGYGIEVSTNGSNWSDLVADTDSTATSYSHTGLTAGSTRYYRVSAINSAGTSAPSSTDSATTDSPPAATAPDAPTGLTATADGQTEIDLSWTAPSNDGGAAITGYRIEVSTDGSSWSDLVADTGSTTTSYSHTGLTAGTTRHYRISAINSAGTGPPSSSHSATTTAAEEPVSDSTCSVDLIVEPGESCTYPGTSTEFSVDSNGTGRFLFASSGSKIEIRSTNINGVTYTFVASKQSDGNWIVEEVG